MKTKTLVLGITGTFASGKSTCAKMFKRPGVSLIDADKINHILINSKGVVYKKIVSVFGQEVLKKNKHIDHKKLGKIVFSNKQKLKKLVQITHPYIIRQMKQEISKFKKAAKIIILDAPLLIEAGLLNIVDKLVVVKTSKSKRIARCKRKGQFSAREASRRVKAQLPLNKKIGLADYIIDNNGTLKQTAKQVKQIWQDILR